MPNEYTRRQALKATGALGATTFLAGCNNTADATDNPTESGSDATAGVQNVDLPDAEPENMEEPAGWATKYSEQLGIKVLATYDSSGSADWDRNAHPHVYVTSNGPGYAGKLTDVENPGFGIIDADKKELVTTRQFELGTREFEPHGSAVSPDGKWIYIPTGDSKSKDMQGRLLIINAETLKLDTVLATKGFPHHVKAFTRYDGKPVVLAYTFNWQIPAWGGTGSGHWLMDPNDDHKIIGGFDGGLIQANPYLSFPHPDRKHLYVGCPPGQITDHDISHHQKGIWAVIDMETWQPVDYHMGGYDPIWTEFTADGKFAFLADGGSDEIYKIDCQTGERVAYGRSAVHGVYGIRLNDKENKLYSVGKGEASHNLGKSLGLVNPKTMAPQNQWEYNCVRGDHALINPFEPTEMWVSCNANSVDVVWDTETDELKETISKSGSSHNGAFVDYSNGGELLFDQAGWHGSALEGHRERLGVSEVVDWGTDLH